MTQRSSRTHHQPKKGVSERTLCGTSFAGTSSRSGRRPPEFNHAHPDGSTGRQASGSEAMFFSKKQSLVGLDIGSYSVKVVEIESLPGGGHRLVNYGISEPLSE